MKPKKSSKKINPLGEIMNLPDAFKEIKKTKHDSSFENLGDWLANNNSKPKKMKSFYKIAASFVLTALIFIACSIPVQQEEEIGYMIKGVSTAPKVTISENMKRAKVTFGNQIVMSYLMNEGGGEKDVNHAEVVLLLPDADESEARSKMEKLNSTFNFDTIDLMAIEESVEKPLYEAALSKININFGSEISEEVIVERFNKTLNEKSNISGKASIKKDANGNKVVEIIMEERRIDSNSKDALNTIDPNSIKSIRISKDKNGDKIIDIDVEEIKEN